MHLNSSAGAEYNILLVAV